ncbi:MAG: type II toxin-antitoxin system YafQ family toxin [Candidatus Magasanikbacteria bacterium]|jgi:mRNA interferase YafQ
MKYHLRSTKDFRKQYKKLVRSGNKRALEELDDVIYRLSMGENLEEKYRNHKLTGEMQDCFECHILFDWLLIYKKYEDILVLKLVATGSHSDLFE